jgi:hypothetical protein
LTSVITAMLGGFVGALVSLLVSFTVEQRRLRGEVALKVVDHLQETYRTMEVFMVQRDFRSGVKDRSLYDEDVYKQAKLRLREIVLNDTIRAQVAVTFGQGDAVGLLEGIQRALREIVETTWTTPGVSCDWIRDRMTRVDEDRNQLERQLLNAARAPWFLRWL